MKSTILKISTVILFFVFLMSGCKKDEPNRAMFPGLVIYKTQYDYFNNVNFNLKDGKVYYLPDIPIREGTDGKIYHKYRVRMNNGYIFASADHLINSAFLDYTIEEFHNLVEIQKVHPSFDYLDSKIINADPFIEFYYDTIPLGFGEFEFKDTIQINEIISKGEIEKYFKKLK